jgi:hypothetical protein
MHHSITSEVIDNCTSRWHDPDRKVGDRYMTSRALVFLGLAIVGLLGQLAIAGVFLADNGLDLGEAGDQIFSSTIAALTFADLMTCAVIFLAWLPREAARAGLRWWPFALATLGGLCFAFALFLYARERRLGEGVAPVRPAEAF